MSVPRAIIERNLQRVQNRIRLACERAGRGPNAPRLVAVTKSAGLDEVQILQSLGFTDFAENRLDGALPKIHGLAGPACWHMIGNVQRRKVASVVTLFDRVDSVDRVELADALERRCAEQDKTLNVLLEVNVSGEASKHGFTPADLPAAVDAIRYLRHLNVEGLMTMAPLDQDAEAARPVFAGLRELASAMELRELSMGMSNDFEVAIEEGATQLRIGSALFEEE